MNKFSKAVVYWLSSDERWWQLTKQKVDFALEHGVDTDVVLKVWVYSAATENVEWLQEKGTRLDRLMKSFIGLALNEVNWDEVSDAILETMAGNPPNKNGTNKGG